MMTPDFDPLARFLLIHTVLLAVGLTASALVRRKDGPTAATLIQRMALASVAASMTLLFVPLPALNLAILPPVVEADLPRTVTNAPPIGERAQKAFPPVPVFTSVSDAEPDIAADVPSKRFLLTFLVSVVWGGGVLVGVGTLLLGLGRLRQMARESSPGTDESLLAFVGRMAEASGVRAPNVRRYCGPVPFLAGILRPTLYLPADDELRGDALQAALAHEMRHLVRRDLAWNLAARVLCIALWFQPLLWILWRTMESAAEEDCDEAALRRGVAPRAYADLLLRLSALPKETHPPLTVAAGMASFRSQIGQRIARVLEGKPLPPLTPARRALSLAGGIAASLCAVALAQVRLTPAIARSAKEPPPAISRKLSSLTYQEAEDIFRMSAHWRGDPSAEFALVEFSDFSCPSCRRAYHLIAVALAPGRRPVLQYAFRHFPLEEMHPMARPMALAAENAGRQGKFWQAWAALMSDSEPTDINRRLRAAGVDKVRFDRDAKGPTAANILREDLKLAKDLDINSTPTFLLLNRRQKTVTALVGGKDLEKALAKTAGSPFSFPETAEGANFPPLAMQDVRRPVSLKAVNMPLKEALDSVFEQGKAHYQIVPGATLRDMPITMTFDREGFLNAARRLLDAANPPFGVVGEDNVWVVRPLPPSGIVTGRVVYPDGKPAVGVAVGGQMQDAAIMGSVKGDWPKDDSGSRLVISGSGEVTDANGVFRLRRMGDCPYNISASPPTNAQTGRVEDNGWTAASLRGVRGIPGKTMEAGTIRLTRGAIIEGTIVNAAGDPVPNIGVGCHGPHHPDTSAAVTSGRADAQGRFRFRVPPGESIVYLMLSPSVKAGISRLDGAGRTVPASRSPRLSESNILVRAVEGRTERIRFRLR